MIIRCQEKNRQEIMAYLYQKPELNLFLIGDIEKYGFDNKDQTIFMDYNKKISCIYLLYYNNLAISANGNIDENFISRLIDWYQVEAISGDKQTLKNLDIPNFTKKECHFASISNYSCQDYNYQVQVLDKSGIRETIYNSNNIFSNTVDFHKKINEVAKKSARLYGIYDNKKIVAGASSTAECSKLAMIISVYTLKEYRNQGYATNVVKKLVSDLCSENKTVCLFYDDLQAQAIYTKIGFKPVGEFLIFKRQTNAA